MEEYQAGGIHEMSWDDFTAVVDFYERSGLRHICLLGGEPCLHSRFMDILHFLERRKFAVLVGTTGILPESLLGNLAENSLRQVFFTLNSTSYFDYGKAEKEQVDRFLLKFGRKVFLSYTITERDLGLYRIEPILDRMALFMKYDLRRHLQFQIAVPADGNHLFIPFDRYRDLVELILGWFSVLKKNRIHHRLDCHCMPACAIPEDLSESGLFTSRCERFMLDFGPGGDVWPCFPLSQQAARLNEFDTMEDLYRHFSRINAPEGILYDEQCRGCRDREEATCHGGCRGFQHLRGDPGAERNSTLPPYPHCVGRAVPCA
jgi:radical SAM protein with 4Fe4S-binding SPASM domain